jgi:hypothetical protein
VGSLIVVSVKPLRQWKRAARVAVARIHVPGPVSHLEKI